MKSALLVLFSILLIVSCENTPNNVTMPTEPQVLAKTVDDTDAFIPLLSKGKGKGPFDKTTGDVQYSISGGKKLCWIFNAQSLTHDMPGIGKGKMTYIRYDSDDEVDRTREFNVTYVSIIDNEGWFVCQCTYDTNGISTDKWFMVHVVDGGEPGVGEDKFRIQLRIDEDDAEDGVDNMDRPGDKDINEGNIQVHQYD